MEEIGLQEKPGLFNRLVGRFLTQEEEYVDEPASDAAKDGAPKLRQDYRYTVTVRRQVTAFEDALAAANGLKRGEQQILNLSGCNPELREKIVHFMCGVNFAQEGTWEEVADHTYLVVPATAYVEVAPSTPRVNAIRN
jgi:cell division inhibitor SepF